MLDWILVAGALPPILILRARRKASARRVRMADEALNFLQSQLASMQPVDAPKASNDNVLAVFYEEVERDLREAGYLRA